MLIFPVIDVMWSIHIKEILCSYLGKAKQCELLTQITFYNINFDVLSQIYRTIHFHMMKLLI